MLPVLAKIAHGEVRPTTAALRWATPGAYPTTDEPMVSFVARFTDAQKRAGVLAVSANHGFEGSDQADTGSSVVVTTDGDLALANAIANEVATDFLAVIRSQNWVAKGVTAAVDEALAHEGRPVVLADSSDNPGGGSAGDATFVLAELIRRNATDTAVALLWDPVAVRLCGDAGVGAVLPLRIGGKAGPMSGMPLDVEAEVMCVRDDAMQSLFARGEPNYRLGHTAMIRVGGIEIVLNSARQQVFSTHCFSEHGIDPSQRHVLVVKSTQHFMNGFGPIASKVVRCEGPGTMSPDLSLFPYRKVRRPFAGIDSLDLITIEAF
jgi:microcystin degradation protein MlrC